MAVTAKRLRCCLLRSYFLYTPLLPACATGTVEERSIVEPVRRVLNNKVRSEYHTAVSTAQSGWSYWLLLQ